MLEKISQNELHSHQSDNGATAKWFTLNYFEITIIERKDKTML